MCVGGRRSRLSSRPIMILPRHLRSLARHYSHACRRPWHCRSFRRPSADSRQLPALPKTALTLTRPGLAAAQVIRVQGDCLLKMHRYAEAAAAFEESIARDMSIGNLLTAHGTKLQLATVRLRRKQYDESLAAFEEVAEFFSRCGEPREVAAAWHQIGRARVELGSVRRQDDEYDKAEQAFRESLTISVAEGYQDGQAFTLQELGSLYDTRGRYADAASFFEKAAMKYRAVRDLAGEKTCLDKLADSFRKLPQKVNGLSSGT